jgi:hypothetical protein
MTNIFLFRTDIEYPSEELELMLNHLVERWSIDIEDVDRVLKVVTSDLQRDQVVDNIHTLGYRCEELT